MFHLMFVCSLLFPDFADVDEALSFLTSCLALSRLLPGRFKEAVACLPLFLPSLSPCLRMYVFLLSTALRNRCEKDHRWKLNKENFLATSLCLVFCFASLVDVLLFFFWLFTYSFCKEYIENIWKLTGPFKTTDGEISCLTCSHHIVSEGIF